MRKGFRMRHRVLHGVVEAESAARYLFVKEF